MKDPRQWFFSDTLALLGACVAPKPCRQRHGLWTRSHAALTSTLRALSGNRKGKCLRGIIDTLRVRALEFDFLRAIPVTNMSIQDTTIKRLFGMSNNQCAIPDCKSPLIIGDVVVCEICHIRARRKGGARYDATLTEVQKDHFDNLILLCGTCHKLIDSSPDEYRADWLHQVKTAHERRAPQPLDLSMADVRHALAILAKHLAKTRKVKMTSGDVQIAGGVHSTATHGAVSVAIGGANQGNIHIKGIRVANTG